MNDKETVILSNQVKCLHCKGTPYSTHRHDFQSCKCGSVSVDGGQNYLRRVGDSTLMLDMSIVWDKKLVDSLNKAVEEAISTGRNSFGITCAVARCLRDNGYEIKGER